MPFQETMPDLSMMVQQPESFWRRFMSSLFCSFRGEKCYGFSRRCKCCNPSSIELKTQKNVTRFYKKFMRESILSNMDVSFIQVESHSGHRFNELADRLAKLSLEWG